MTGQHRAEDPLLTKGTEPVHATLARTYSGGFVDQPLTRNATARPGDTVVVAVEPTQVRRPWRATVRTGFQAALAIATLVPFIVTGVYDDGDTPVVVTQVVVASATFSRVMALPQVNDFLARFLPFLSAAGR